MISWKIFKPDNNNDCLKNIKSRNQNQASILLVLLDTQDKN